MSKRVLTEIASQIISSDTFSFDTVIVWHAGEPTTLPVEWYEEAYHLFQSKTGHKIRFQFQTNGTLLSKKWISVIERFGWDVGLSIDGPEEVHDFYRKTRAGEGTFAKAIDAVYRLKEAGLKFTAIATVTDKSLRHVDEIFDFFYDIRPEFLGFSVEEAEGANHQSTIYRYDIEPFVEEFFLRIARKNFASDRPLRIREVENTIGALFPSADRHHRSFECNQETALGRIVSVGADGSLAFFSPELLTTASPDGKRPGVIGNICKKSFSALCEEDRLAHLRQQIGRGVSSCKEHCEYFRFCGGGSPANKLFETGRLDSTETWFCKIGKKAVANGVMQAISELKEGETHG